MNLRNAPAHRVTIKCDLCTEEIERDFTRVELYNVCFTCKQKRRKKLYKLGVYSPRPTAAPRPKKAKRKRQDEFSLNDWPWKHLGY